MKKTEDYYDHINENGYYEQKSIKELIFKNQLAKKIKRKTRNPSNNTDDVLSEFSNDNSNFYEDEVKKKNRANIDSSEIKKRKPATPTKRKAKKAVSFILIVGVLLIVTIILSLTILFKVQKYEVSGTTLYTSDEIIEKSGISPGENLFLASKGAAASRIEKSFPYVEKANLLIKIPDTLLINITEASESYLVKNGETEYLVISSKGRILNKTETPSDYNLPIFLGPQATVTEVGKDIEYEDDKVLKIINEISEVFSDNGYQNITQIDASNTANISFTYDGRIKVVLGIPEQLSYKIRTAMTIIEEKIDVNKTVLVEGELDVSKVSTTKKSYFNEASLLELGKPEDEEKEKGSKSTEGNLESAIGELFADDEEDDDEDSEEVEEETQKLSPEQWYVN